MDEQPRQSAYRELVNSYARAAEMTDEELRVAAAEALGNPGTTVLGPAAQSYTA